MADAGGARRALRLRARVAHRRAVRELAQTASRAAPVDTGQLRRSVRIVGERDAGSTFTATLEVNRPRTPGQPDNVDVAGFVEHGTRPHVIRARTAKVLRFRTGGRIRFASSVQHPGTRARPWWGPTVKRWPEVVRRAWRTGR